MSSEVAGEPCYIEYVSRDAAGTIAGLEASTGLVFGPSREALGGARTAATAAGTVWAVRAPMHEQEQPATRVYARVADVEATVAAAVAAGATLMLEPMAMPDGLGTIAIWSAGGMEQAAWQLPE